MLSVYSRVLLTEVDKFLTHFWLPRNSKSRWLRFGEWKWSREQPLNGKAHGMFIYGHFGIVWRANQVCASIMRILLARWEVNLLAFASNSYFMKQNF